MSEYSTRLTTAPSDEPVTTTEMKAALGLGSGSDHDTRLTALIAAARQKFETDTGSAVLTQTWEHIVDNWDEEICLTRFPVQSITSIQYYDGAGTLQTLSSSIYQLDIAKREVRLAYLQNWPVAQPRWDAIKITYVAGYSSVALVPEQIKQAVKLLAAHWFEAPDMMINDNMHTMAAYNHLIRPLMRATYP